TLSGGYPQESVDRLIALSRADVGFFPAQIPESFSFTLSAALRAGLPVVASRLGSFPERLAGLSNTALCDWNASAGEWNDALIRQASNRKAAPPMDNGEAGTYAKEYLAPMAILSSVHAERLPIPAHRYFPPRELPKGGADSLQHLYVGGVKCGNTAAARELERRIGDFDAQLTHANEQTARAEESARQAVDRERAVRLEYQEIVETVQKGANDWQAAYEHVLRSRSWQVTAPLRWAGQEIRRMRTRLRLLPMRLALAVRILTTQGPRALWYRIRSKFQRRYDAFGHGIADFKIESARLPIVLPCSSHPKWSIIVPVYGQHDMTYTCLKSIGETCANLEIEVIVADDCSPEPVQQALPMVEGARVLRNPANMGFLRTCNHAVAEARGEYLVLLNNDTIVTKDWLTQLTAVFEKHPEAGLAGVKLLFPDGTLQEAGGIVWRDGSAWNYGRGMDPRSPEFNYWRDVDYCSGACIMLPMAVWRSLDGFDARYAPAYYEDTDLAFRVRESGRRVIYQPHAEVVHFEGQSSGTDLSQGIKRHQVLNQAVFEERWRGTLAKHRPHGIAPQRERDRASTRRVLVFDVCVPRPDRDSGSLRMVEILTGLRELGCRVTFMAEHAYQQEEYIHALQSLGVEVYFQTQGRNLEDVLRRYAADFDTVILSRAPVAARFTSLVRATMPHAKLIYDTVDLHHLRLQREAELSGSALDRIAAEKMRALECESIASADLTLVVSPYEQAILETEVPRAHVMVLSNIHDPDPGDAPFPDRSGAVFIGGFLHPPNADAMHWYADAVLPILRERAPGLVTTVIGSDVPEAVSAKAAPDFVFKGFVPDVKPLYNSARVAISPLRYGAGVKGKVNLAMQYGVPVVATTVSVEGMQLEDGRNVVVADSAEAFAQAIIDVHGDNKRWNALREGGIQNIRDHFSRAHAKAILREILDL
ncbi:MAG: glycosyltransferase, partial [Betaproteobacteria bacterium]|nr:glycosyltransferase [Betaproteobacteria bacterium]